MFEEIEHTADYARDRVQSDTLAGLLVEAAHGMYKLTGGCYAAPCISREIEISSADEVSLLVAWLEELAFLLEMEGLIFDELQVLHATPHRLLVVATGGQVHNLTRLIKAVTFHDLAINKTAAGLETTVVFDV